MSNWVEVKSGNISAIAYTAGDPDGDLGTLYVRFTSGSKYHYDDVPNQLAVDFFAADSKGKFFHANIRSGYVGVKQVVKEEREDDGEGQQF